MGGAVSRSLALLAEELTCDSAECHYKVHTVYSCQTYIKLHAHYIGINRRLRASILKRGSASPAVGHNDDKHTFSSNILHVLRRHYRYPPLFGVVFHM